MTHCFAQICTQIRPIRASTTQHVLYVIVSFGLGCPYLAVCDLSLLQRPCRVSDKHNPTDITMVDWLVAFHVCWVFCPIKLKRFCNVFPWPYKFVSNQQTTFSQPSDVGSCTVNLARKITRYHRKETSLLVITEVIVDDCVCIAIITRQHASGGST